MFATPFLLTAVLSLAPQAGTTPQAVNARCPVTGQDVRNHLLYHHVTVRNRAYYVASREAAARLRQSPDAFLAKDGTPLLEVR